MITNEFKKQIQNQLPKEVKLQYHCVDNNDYQISAIGDADKNHVFLDSMLERETSFSEDALLKSRQLKGICLGAGSIGGSTFLNLVRFGVSSEGGLEIVDPEKHEISNLPRQATDFVFIDNWNINKAINTLISGLRINPYMKAKSHAYGVTENNLEQLIHEQNYAIMGIDASRPELLASLIITCDKLEIPLFGGLDIGTLRITHTMLPGKPSLIRDAISPEKIIALEKGLLHPLTWLAGMTRVEHIPFSFLMDLSRLLSGQSSYIPQSRIASEPQAIHTVANIINYFSGNFSKVPSFTAQDMIYGIFQQGSKAYEEEKAKKIAFAKGNDDLSKLVLATLGVNTEEYLELLAKPRPFTL